MTSQKKCASRLELSVQKGDMARACSSELEVEIEICVVIILDPL